MDEQTAKIKIRKGCTGEIREYEVPAFAIVGDYAITRLADQSGDHDSELVFGEEWTITMPNGYAFGWYPDPIAAMVCAGKLKEVATGAELVRIHGKKRRTAAEKALVDRIKAIVTQFVPTEEGEL